MKDLTYTLENFSRFELFPNTTNIRLENAFSIWGILIFPIIVGSLLLYHVFGVRGVFFWSSFGLFLLVLINIFIFYRTQTYKENVHRLILDRNFIQMINQSNIQFQADIRDVTVENLKCSKEGYPAIRIYNEELQSIIIGFRQSSPSNNHENSYPLSQPDYWIQHKKEWNKLQDIINQNI